MIRSLSGRVFLVLLIGVMASACLTLWLTLGERQRSLIQYREAHFLERAEQLILDMDALPVANRARLIKLAPRLGLKIDVVTVDGTGTDKSATPIPLPENSPHVEAIADKLGSDFHVVSLASIACPQPVGRGNSLMCEAFAVTLRDQSMLTFSILPPRTPVPPLNADFYLYLIFFLLSIAGLTYFVTRMTIRPLQQLSQAAVNLGNDINHPPLIVSGATELRQASNAFNAMQARIRQYIQQRTHILAAITHDLQTPLTRLRLRLEKVEDVTLRDRLIADLSAMQSMVREGLSLARSMDSNETMQTVDLDSLLDSVVSDACDAGQNVTLEGTSRMSIRAQPQALLRCVNNLVDNALKYGQFAKVTVRQEADHTATIRIRDGGVGIPDAELEKVFTPFYRLETSRSRESGGTGLGLTIARNICEQHGGTLSLRNHPEGGLEVTLNLPGKAFVA